MRVSVDTLRRFYATPLGETARRLAARRLAALWTDCAGLDVLGVGYACPFLPEAAKGARRVVCVMPWEQGAVRWPASGPAAAVLSEESRLPFLDAVFDRVLVVHALEESARPQVLLRQLWRVMAPEGRLLVVAANRVGLWAHMESTPFGHGRPYSRAQLGEQLREAMFQPTASALALHAPPVAWRPALALAESAERAGDTLRSPFAGLVMMEATKRLHATGAGAAAQTDSAPLGVSGMAPAAPRLRNDMTSV